MKINQNQTITSRTEFLYYAFRNILLVSLPFLLISGFALSLSHSSAVNNSSTDSVSINLPISCTLSASGSSSHNTSMVSGQLKEDIGLTEINTLCNDKNGYVIYAKGITQNSNNEVVLSSTIGPNYDIKTGNIPTTNNNSSWAFKLSAVSGDYGPTIENTYNNQYAPVPNTWTKVVSRSSGTSTNTDISNTVKSAFTTTYAVYTTPSQPAGTYLGQVQYFLLHPSTNSNLATTIDNAFFLAGKTRLILKDDGTTVEEGSSEAENIPEENIIGRYYKMQDMDPWICGAVTYVDTPSEAQLIDIRDNKTYYVTKLKDNNCWMTQNLALDLETTPTNVAPLTSENTDLNDNSLTGAYELGYTYENNVLTWRPANATIKFSGTSAGGANNRQHTPYSYNKTDSIYTGHQSTGNYYTWTAIIASNDSSSLIENTLDNTSNNPKNSICPKGWRLPIASSRPNDEDNSTNEFGRLNYIYNSNSTSSDEGLIQSPLYFTKSGFVHGGLSDYGGSGYYQTSTIYDSLASYVIRFKSNDSNPLAIVDYNRWGGRTNGFSLRCLAR